MDVVKLFNGIAVIVDNEIEENETWISKLFDFMGMSLYILITGFITVSLPLLIIFL